MSPRTVLAQRWPVLISEMAEFVKAGGEDPFADQGLQLELARLKQCTRVLRDAAEG